jgi:DNA modification methylase
VTSALIIQGDARRLPLADETADLVVTSPPFWNLRDYGVAGQLGNEPTMDGFLGQLWDVTAECIRVMKPTASLFVELGDSYTNKSLNLAPQRYAIGCTDKLGLILRAEVVWHRTNGLPESVDDRVRVSHSRWFHMTKSPRYYSALDELREPYEAKPQRRFSPRKIDTTPRPDGQSPRTPEDYVWEEPSAGANPLGKPPGSVWSIPSEPLDLPDYLVRLPTGVTMMDAGPLWRHVEWMRRTGQPGPVLVRELDHYAAFASEWPRRLILGWSPPGICIECGQGRWPVVDRRNVPTRPSAANGDDPRGRGEDRWRQAAERGGPMANYNSVTEAQVLGYACACTPHTDHPGTGEGQWVQDERTDGRLSGLRAEGASRRPAMNSLQNYTKVGPWREYHLAGWTPPPTRPAVVLDPFGGVGTTAAVGRALGRTVVTLDLSHDYSLAAQWRVLHAPTVAKTVTRTNAGAQSQAVDPGPRVPVAPKPPTLTYRDAAAEQANRERQGALL